MSAADFGIARPRLILDAGRALYLGPVPTTTPHAHHALQVCVALQKPFRVRADHGPWRSMRGAVVGSDERHEMQGSGTSVALLYLDPETAPARAITGRRPGGRIEVLRNPALTGLRRILTEAPLPDGDPDAPRRLLEALCRLLTPSPGSRATDVLDPRLRAALGTLRSSDRRHVSLATLAREVGLSASRLAHLFREEVGLPTRRYRLWLRLADAIDELARGSTVTDAAHEAGFADSAHLTRTCRRMFGIAPSELRLARFTRVTRALGGSSRRE